LIFSLHRKSPEPAAENVFTVLQGLFYQLEKGVDDLGCLSLGEDVFGEECFHDVGFGESHGLLLKNERKNPFDSGKFNGSFESTARYIAMDLQKQAQSGQGWSECLPCMSPREICSKNVQIVE
jgi:hypothetical protein